MSNLPRADVSSPVVPGVVPPAVPLTGSDCFLRAFDDEVRRYNAASHVSQLILRLGPGFDVAVFERLLDTVTAAVPFVRAPIRRRYGEERSFVVLYERLMEDPNPALRAACRMLGEREPEGELQLGVPLEMPEVHGPDGNGKLAPTEVVLTVDNRWQSELHPFDRVLMTLLTFPFLRHYGYPIRTKRASGGGVRTSVAGG